MGIEWFALLIPLIAIGILLYFFKSKVLWWEALIPLVVTLPIILTSKFTSEYIQTKDTEYHTNYVNQIRYYEDWNQLVTYTVMVKVGKTSVPQVRTRIDYHPPRWVCELSNSEELGISESKYAELKSKLGSTEKFEDLHRPHYTNDGNLYFVNFSGRNENIVSVTSEFSYKNKIQSSKSIHNYETVDKYKYELIDYPEIDPFNTPSILGYKSAEYGLANNNLALHNAILGPEKWVRIWFICFKNKPIDAGIEQEAYWVGGNDNEFVVCIGLDENDSVKWCHVFSWTKKQQLKIDVRNYIVSQKKFDLPLIVDFTALLVKSDYEWRDFSEFDYISVPVTSFWLFLTYFVTIIATVGIALWTIFNNINED